VPATTVGSGDGTAAAATAPDRSTTGGFLLLQSIIINISRESRHTGAATTVTNDARPRTATAHVARRRRLVR